MNDLYSRCKNSTNKIGDQFVGIKFDGDVLVTFPIGYEIPTDEKELRKQILLLIKSFELTNSNIKTKVCEGTAYKNEFQLPLHSYFWLIKDYLDKGLYKACEKDTVQKGSGKINWKKTIQKTVPALSNGSFVYIEPYYDQSRNQETLITEIEKYCLNLANVFLGWLFGEINISKSIFDDSKVNYMKTILQKELLVSFSDYKKTLLINMMNVLTGLDDELVKSKAYSYGTYNYNVVWERLVNSVFGNVKNISDYYPHASWNLDKLNISDQPLVPLRQDSIYYDKFTNKYFIYDAKYYGASLHRLLDGLPSTSDIEKQITYGQEIAINKDIDPNKIYNAFILPYNKTSNLFGLCEDIQYIGEANPSWVRKNYTYERVELIFVDTYFLLNEWKKKTIKWYREMSKIIEENI